jgi:hypothetical protein
MIVDDLFENTAGPEKCWPGYRKVGTKPGTGGNAGKRVNDCEKIRESAGEFGIGDPVIITGDVEFQGKTGDVREIGQDGAFVVVNLYNYGPYSFHTSDVSYNDYADSEDADDVAEGGILKSIKRGLQGWSGDTDLAITGKRNKPKDVVQRTKGYDTDTLKSLSKNPAPAKGSPAALQQKVISRELKKRGEQGVAEGSTGLSIQQLATISDEALDKAYGYGRSTPGNTFGWQANMMSASYAKKMIDSGVTDIEAISDAIHKGWNVTAQKFVANPDQFSDTEKLRAAGKLDAKLQQRAQLMKQNYAQLPEEEKEKDRVVARALLKALGGSQGVAEGSLAEKAEKAEKNDQPWVDPKLKRRMDYAFGHYAGYKDKPEAFFKWVMNSIDHSEQTDQQHDERFDRIEREIEQLSQRLRQVNEQHGSAVANRFSQRLVEHFELDRPTADPTRSVFVESRAAKRAVIREIFARQG